VEFLTVEKACICHPELSALHDRAEIKEFKCVPGDQNEPKIGSRKKLPQSRV
jgi:hypothetical protein